MALTCGVVDRCPAAYSKSPGQIMIICIRGGLEPLAYILGGSTEPWLSV